MNDDPGLTLRHAFKPPVIVGRNSFLQTLERKERRLTDTEAGSSRSPIVTLMQAAEARHARMDLVSRVDWIALSVVSAVII